MRLSFKRLFSAGLFFKYFFLFFRFFYFNLFFFAFCFLFSWKANCFFLVQEVFSLAFLFRVLVNRGLTGLLAIFLVKISIAPFHIWVNKVLVEIKWGAVLLFFSFFKIPRFWLLFQIVCFPFFLVISGFCFVSSLFLYYSVSIKFLFLFSSRIHSYFILFVAIQIILWGSFYVFCYCFIVFFFFNSFFSLNKKERVFSFLFLCILIGMPPFPFFLFKWLLICFLLKKSVFAAALLCFLVLLSIFGYFRIISLLTNIQSFGRYSVKIALFFNVFFWWRVMLGFFNNKLKKLLVFKTNI